MLVICALGLLSSLVAGNSLWPRQNSSDATVTLDFATYEGTYLPGDDVKQFLGMRYAAPPTGDLRFRAPQDVSTYTEVQDATKFRSLCVGLNEVRSSTKDEDCLFVNVWTPANASVLSKLPVWVYIQGGGYGQNSNANYNGSNVVAKSGHQIVFVNFNYRVGALGFLASEKIRADGDLNAGLLDQRKLLEWVQKYIEKFGGNPKHVVIHGTSAGGGSVSHHLAAYGGRNDGLFVGAAANSPFWPVHRPVKELEWQYERFASKLNCSGVDDEVACLRSINIDVLQKANVASAYPGVTAVPRFYFLPCIDGDFSRDTLYNGFQRGQIVKIPFMVGHTANEGASFSDNATTWQEALNSTLKYYTNLTSSDLVLINESYPLLPPRPKHNAWFPSAAEAYGDSTFICPALFSAKSVAVSYDRHRSWVYRYNIQDPSSIAAGIGVSHAADTAAIFGVGYAGGKGTSLENINADLVPVMMNYYISFVRSLNPNTYRYGMEMEEYIGSRPGPGRRLRIQTNSTAEELVPRELQSKCLLWHKLNSHMQQ